MAQSKLEQAKRRQQQPRRNASLVHIDLDFCSHSATVEVINLFSDSPQQNPITIVTYNSPNDFMAQPGPRRKSMDLIVQKIKRTNEENSQQPEKPERAEQGTSKNKDPTNALQLSHQGKEPIRDKKTDHSTQPKRDHMTIITIPDCPNSKTTILIHSEEDHPTTSNAPILASTELQIAAESTRIFEQPNHTKDEISHVSPASTYSTAPSEITPTAIQSASQISSLDTDDIEYLIQIFGC